MAAQSSRRFALQRVGFHDFSSCLAAPRSLSSINHSGSKTASSSRVASYFLMILVLVLLPPHIDYLAFSRLLRLAASWFTSFVLSLLILTPLFQRVPASTSSRARTVGLHAAVNALPRSRVL
ncbi:hypothetical protein R1flu_012703 [Riccia fluitans]|uniref:Uncharacterized protein n=1 Tax=Riccia fluitans TaxID=41844 RepID=A0ABD1ZBH8_9MARC